MKSNECIPSISKDLFHWRKDGQDGGLMGVTEMSCLPLNAWPGAFHIPGLGIFTLTKFLRDRQGEILYGHYCGQFSEVKIFND